MTKQCLGRNRRTSYAWTILIFIASLAFYFSYYDRGMIIVDEGILVHAAQRILRGEIPYRDFYHFYAPGRFYVLAGIFKVFGESFLVSRMMWVLVKSVNVLLTFLIATRLMPKHFAIFPAAFLLFVTICPWPLVQVVLCLWRTSDLVDFASVC